MNCIEGYDIILPQSFYFRYKVYEQYLKYHPKKDMDLALEIIVELYPEYTEAVDKVMNSSEIYTCLNFIMKKELLKEYFEWIFSILTMLEKRSDWSQYQTYMDVRTPAYIAERLINIWLEHNIKTRNLKVLNTTSVLLIGKGYGNVNAKMYIEKYLWQVQQMRIEKAEKL